MVQLQIFNQACRRHIIIISAYTSEVSTGSRHMRLTSSAFLPFTDIPSLYTCEGIDRPPPLLWADVPAQAKSLILIIDDPDAPNPAAPRMTWVHWILYNIPPDITCLDCEKPDSAGLPPAILYGLNDAKQTHYHGPCPPVGRHRYFHKLYALDCMLPDLRHPTKAMLEKAMQGHVLAQCELVGYYKKQGRVNKP